MAPISSSGCVGQSCYPLDKHVRLGWNLFCSRKSSGTFLFQNFCGSWKTSLGSLGGLVLLNRCANTLPRPRCDLALATCAVFLGKVRGPLF